MATTPETPNMKPEEPNLKGPDAKSADILQNDAKGVDPDVITKLFGGQDKSDALLGRVELSDGKSATAFATSDSEAMDPRVREAMEKSDQIANMTVEQSEAALGIQKGTVAALEQKVLGATSVMDRADDLQIAQKLKEANEFSAAGLS